MRRSVQRISSCSRSRRDTKARTKRSEASRRRGRPASTRAAGRRKLPLPAPRRVDDQQIGTEFVPQDGDGGQLQAQLRRRRLHLDVEQSPATLQSRDHAVKLLYAGLEARAVVILAQRDHPCPVPEFRGEHSLPPRRIHDVFGGARPLQVCREDERTAEGPNERQQEQQPELPCERRFHRDSGVGVDGW